MTTTRRKPPASKSPTGAEPIDTLAARMRACRICIDRPLRAPLPHEPRPVFRISASARIAVCSQAPGNRAHMSGLPFTDASGVRLRSWMGVTDDEFYDAARVAILPMGFCFPGYDAKGGDLPPRKECAPAWRELALAAIGDLEVLLLVGGYAQRWHLGAAGPSSLTETVREWRRFAGANQAPRIFPLPHPSWRNNAWIARNAWFSNELLPEMKTAVRAALDRAGNMNFPRQALSRDG